MIHLVYTLLQFYFCPVRNMVKKNFVLLAAICPLSWVLILQTMLPSSALTPMSPPAPKICNAVPNKLLQSGNSKVLMQSFLKLNNSYECTIVAFRIIPSPIENIHTAFLKVKPTF